MPTVIVDAYMGGVWVDISAWWMPDPAAVVTHGDLSGTRRPEAGKLQLSLDNTDGRFTEGLPSSPYYGEWGRGTQISIWADGNIRCTCKIDSIQLTRPSDTLCVARIQAVGPLAELGHAPPIGYPLTSYISALPALVDYWPMEDGDQATRYASATNRSPLRIDRGSVTGLSEGWAGNDALPILGSARLIADIPTWTATGAVQVSWSMEVPATITAERAILWWSSSGTCRRWWVLIDTSGNLVIRAYGAGEASILDSTMTADWRGKRIRATVEMTQVGSDIDWDIAAYDVTPGSIGVTIGAIISGRTLGRPVKMRVNPNGDAPDIAVGHLAVANAVGSLYDAADAVRGFAGEVSWVRLWRISAELGITRYIATAAQTSSFALGPQVPGGALDTLRACAEPLGTIHEMKNDYAIRYEDQHTNRTVGSARHWSTTWATITGIAAIDWTHDRQAVANTATITRTGGGTSTHTVTGGTLGADAIGHRGPPRTMGLHTDDQTEWLAQWATYVGTHPGARIPQITIRMHATTLDGTTRTTIRNLVVGDRITLANPPAWCGPEPIDVIIEGYREVITAGTWEITPVLSPARIWDCGLLEDATTPCRLDTAGSSVVSTVSAAGTSMSVATPDGTPWTTNGAHFPFDVSVSGIRVTVTAISGTASPQTFTVTGSTVTKSLPAGSAVSLWTPARVVIGGDIT